MSEFHDIKILPLKIPEKEIFLRLGGNIFKTNLGSDQEKLYQKTVLEAFELCVPAGRWGMTEVEKTTGSGVLCRDGEFIEGADFAAENPDISHLWYGAVTLGSALNEKIDSLTNVTEKAIFDAVGSECADAAMDLLFSMAKTVLRSSGITLAMRRYSPGYGDMPLKMQNFFFQKLQLSDLGIKMTETYFLTPEKSVTAFAGGIV